jgi:hypothetical protein
LSFKNNLPLLSAANPFILLVCTVTIKILSFPEIVPHLTFKAHILILSASSVYAEGLGEQGFRDLA